MSAAELHLVDDDLHHHLTDTIAPFAEVDEHFVVDTDEKATWAARKAQRAQAEVDRIRAQADTEIARIREWADDATRTAQHDHDFFVGLLDGYLHRLLDEHGDSLPKTYKVIGADLTRRKSPDTLTIDEDAEREFVAWALEHDRDLVKIKPSPQAVKSLVDLAVEAPDLDLDAKGKPAVMGQTSRLVHAATGEVIPGAIYRVGDERYTIKLTGGAA